MDIIPVGCLLSSQLMSKEIHNRVSIHLGLRLLKALIGYGNFHFCWISLGSILSKLEQNSAQFLVRESFCICH